MVEVVTVAAPARDRVLEAAERVITDVGPARLTLDLVSQAAGVSKGGLLYHFPSKESLLIALAHRYVQSIQQCIALAKEGLAGDVACEVKACILGLLGNDERSKVMGAALLAAAANDFGLLDIVGKHIARHTEELTKTPGANFARAAIVTLAVDGLKMRESLRISPFDDAQREQVVNELLKIADEAYRK
jgi:AcrR family transcriptional regulator